MYLAVGTLVQKYNSAGALVGSFTPTNVSGSITAIQIDLTDPAEPLYVLSFSYSNNGIWVTKYNKTTFANIGSVTHVATSGGSSFTADAFAVSSSHVYVRRYNTTVKNTYVRWAKSSFTGGGTTGTAPWPGSTVVQDEYGAYDPLLDRMVFSSPTDNKIYVLSASGALVTSTTLPYRPQGIAVDPESGALVVSDVVNDSIKVYSDSAATTLVETFGTAGLGVGQFLSMNGIGITANRRLWITDAGSVGTPGSIDRVHYYDAADTNTITGFGFEPEALLLFNPDSAANAENGVNQQLAVVAKDTGGTEQIAALSLSRGHGVASGTLNNTSFGISDTLLMGGVQNDANLTLDADGFTVEWGAFGYMPGRKVGYMALGGSDLSALATGNIGGSGVFDSTDGAGSTVVLTTTGMTARGGLVLASADTEHETASYGMFGQRGDVGIQNAAVSLSATSTDNADANTVSDGCVLLLSSDGSAVLFKAAVTAIGADSVTFTVLTNALPVGVHVFLRLVAFSGSEIEVGTFTRGATTAGTSTNVTMELPSVASFIVSDGSGQAVGTKGNGIALTITGSDFLGNDVTLGSVLTDGGSSTNATDTYAGPADTAVGPVATTTGTTNTYTWPNAGTLGQRVAYMNFDIAVTPLTGDVDVASGGGAAPLRLNHTGMLTAAALLDLAANNAHLQLTDRLTGAGLVSLFASSPLLSGSHPLEGAAVVQLGGREYAYLQENHNLTGGAELQLGHPDQVTFLGDDLSYPNAVGTHMLSAEGVIALGGDPAHLTINYTGKLTTSPEGSIAVTTGHTWPPQDHALTGAAAVEVFANSAFLARDPGPLSGEAVIEATTAAVLRTGAGLRGGAGIALGAQTLGLTGAPLPEPTQLGVDDIPGTVNLFKNPSFEFDANTSSWANTGSASNSFDLDKPWDGLRSLKVSLANAANSGVYLYTQRGLGLKGSNHVFLGQFQIRRNTALTGGLRIDGHVFYTDGTSDSKTFETAFMPGTGWTPYLCPALTVNPAKMVDYVRIAIYREGAAAGQSFSIDGVQIEQDRGKGHTPFATGSYGLPYHKWWGIHGNSLTIRDAIPASYTVHNQFDTYRIETEIWHCKANGTRIEEITEYCYNTEITIDPEKDISRTLKMEIMGEGAEKLSEFKSWIEVYQKVTLPNGTVRQGPYGLFVYWPSPKTEYPWGRVVSLTGYSAEALLKTQGIRGHLWVREGKQLRQVVRVLLKSAHLAEDWQGRDMFYLPPDPGRNERAHKNMTWDKKEILLNVLTDLTKKLGWHPLFTNNRGYLTTVIRKGGDKRLSKQTPVKVYAAEVDPKSPGISPWISTSAYSGNEVVGDVTTEPQMERWDENKFIVISVNPRRKGIKAVRRINDEDNPVSTRRRRTKTKKIEMDVRDQADAEALAEAIAEEINSNMEQVTINVVPDPSVDFTRKVVYLALYNKRKQPIAVGKFKVINQVVGCTHDEAMMKLTLGYVRDLNDMSPNDPTGWDIDDDAYWDWEAVNV